MTSPEALKQQLRELGSRRAGLEQVIAEASDRLDAAGIGLTKSLVDSEGFPLADIDIPAVRADRHTVITLTNDHKELTHQIEGLLHQLHALTHEEASRPAHVAAPALVPADGDASMRVAAPLAVPAASTRPYAVVDEVAEDSPASAAGVQLRDQLIRFGHVMGQCPNPLQAVAALLQESEKEGRQVEAEFLRGEERITLKLLPQRWSGRGLLGCHLSPLR